MFSGMPILFRNSSYLLCLVLVASQFTIAGDIPRHGKPVVLFDGHGLDKFDTFLKSKGLNQDPDRSISGGEEYHPRIRQRIWLHHY